MNPMIENRNYHNDRRVCDRAEAPVFRYEDDEGVEVEVELPWKYEVCPVCEGKGTHVNPSIDCCGLTAEDFAEDPGFAEDYFSGCYDQPCNRCGGLRVVPEVDYDALDDETREKWERHCQEEAEYAAICRAERAMGA